MESFDGGASKGSPLKILIFLGSSSIDRALMYVVSIHSSLNQLYPHPHFPIKSRAVVLA